LPIFPTSDCLGNGHVEHVQKLALGFKPKSRFWDFQF
jgi:hypothetical protein